MKNLVKFCVGLGLLTASIAVAASNNLPAKPHFDPVSWSATNSEPAQIYVLPLQGYVAKILVHNKSIVPYSTTPVIVKWNGVPVVDHPIAPDGTIAFTEVEKGTVSIVPVSEGSASGSIQIEFNF